MARVVSYQIADSIDVRGLRTAYKEGIYHYDADELFYKTDEACYVYVFKYGVVCFLGYNEKEAAAYLEKVGPFCKNLFELRLSEEFEVETNAQENKFGYNKIEIIKPDIEVLRLIMLNVSQSVALDYFSEQANHLQEETNSQTLNLERRGRLRIPLYFRFATRNLGRREPEPHRSGAQENIRSPGPLPRYQGKP